MRSLPTWCLLLAGCGAEPAPPRPHPVAAEPAPAPVRWEHAEHAGSWELLAELTTEAHGPRTSAELRGSEAAVAPWRALTPSTRFPETAVLALRLAPSGRWLALERKAELWEYSEVGADGYVLRRGHLADCARCHAEAPADGVFGPRRPR